MPIPLLPFDYQATNIYVAVELYPGHQMRKCNEDHKHEKLLYGISLWNRALRENSIKFGRTHPETKVTYVDVWDIFYQAFFDPESLKAENATCIDHTGLKCVSDSINALPSVC